MKLPLATPDNTGVPAKLVKSFSRLMPSKCPDIVQTASFVMRASPKRRPSATLTMTSFNVTTPSVTAMRLCTCDAVKGPDFT